MTDERSNPERQEFDICSLAPDHRAILIGRGWEALGYMQYHGRGRRFFDLSRAVPAIVPHRQAPEHWSPLHPIVLERAQNDAELAAATVDLTARPTPAHYLDSDAGDVDTDWPFDYAPAGFISRDEAEHRIMRALKTSRAPGLVKDFRVGYRSNWPVNQIVRSWGDEPSGLTARDFEPTRRDVDDWWRVLTWLVALYPPSQRPPDWQPGHLNIPQRVVRGRSFVPRYSWRQIADVFKRSPEWARRIYQKSIDDIWSAANGR